MHAKRKTEKPLESFILPNESYKWDFILDKYAVEEPDREAITEHRGLKGSVMTALIKTVSSRVGDENSEAAAAIERQSATLVY